MKKNVTSLCAYDLGRFESAIQCFAERLFRDVWTDSDRENSLDFLVSLSRDIGLSDATVSSLQSIGENLLSIY